MSSKYYDWNRLKSLGFDVNYIEETLPETYKKGLRKEEQKIAIREAKDTMKKADTGKVSAKELYEDWESDKRFRKRNKDIPKSKATEAYERIFSEKDSGTDTALKNKAKESGVSLSIIREVFERGMAAWRTGHRPGVAPQQWALGRVNSFLTGKGKARQADEDLWKKVIG